MTTAARPELDLELLPSRYAVVRLPPNAGLPAWLQPRGFRNVAWTADELSIVCEETMPPDDSNAERGWRCFKLRGPFDFALTGILVAVLEPLAAAGIGIFAVSTFDTDYVLVKDSNLQAATDALAKAGHRIL
ncbi:ACT domain-containing protein [Pseudoxanthomonas helianthi]|uniref:ACT domain-containing protein n=1 Tax=Pseudoxanthomonas helianthi TaxID=1453541 RepID=A0A940X3Q1_9GAMM|nr:ACT domain-containing protein [Pseudoxanthomonas helianthi]